MLDTAAIYLALCVSLAVFVDWLLGEPDTFHPLVGFGRLAGLIEKLTNRGHLPWLKGINGALATALVVLPWVWLCQLAVAWAPVPWLVEALVLAFTLGHRSLYDHVRPIYKTLVTGHLDQARQLASRIVSRDPKHMDVPKATIESVLENGNDGIFGALFWFAVGGAPAALAFRLVNTLDAMWGYKTPRFADFGWFAARLDDVMNFVPARLTALSYAIVGETRPAMVCWQEQGSNWKSPNAGPVMATGAGALGVLLGGEAHYHGQIQYRPMLGVGRPAQENDIMKALHLVTQSLFLWLLTLTVISFLW